MNTIKSRLKLYLYLFCFANSVQFSTNSGLSRLHDLTSNVITASLPTTTKRLQKQMSGCDWFPACICKDESRYTNGTYMLLVNCTSAGQERVPEHIPTNTTVLTLNNNRIQTVPPGAFRNLVHLLYLDLSDNNITHLVEGAFEGLEQLHTLELSGNAIRYTDSFIPEKVFSPLTSLKRLNLHQKLTDIATGEIYPTKALMGMTELEQLLIDGLNHEHFGETFSLMKKLRIMDLSSDFGRCHLTKVTVDMFQNLSSIATLQINKCNISTVELRSFSELKNIKKLDMSHNENLGFRSLPNITYGLQNRMLRDLRLIKIHDTYGGCTQLGRENLLYLSNVTIDNVYLDSNRLAYVNEDAVEFIPRNIRRLSLTNNILQPGDYIHDIFDKGVFQHLKTLTISDQNVNFNVLDVFSSKTKAWLQQMDRFLNLSNKNKKLTMNGKTASAGNTLCPEHEDRIGEECRNCNQSGVFYEHIIRLPECLIGMDLSGLRIRNELRNICICEPNKLERLNLRRNIFYNWQGPIVGLSNLLELDLGWNSCDNMSVNVFDNMTNLVQLNLSRNFIERHLAEDTEGRIFRGLKNLTFLYLKDIKLRYLPPKIFDGLVKLQGLDLSHNFLTQFDVVFSHTVPLQYLDLSNNYLQTISQTFMQKLDDRTKQIKKFDYYYLDLTNNRLTCNCNNTDFIKWLTTTNVQLIDLNTYTCTYEDGRVKNLSAASDLYRDLQKNCAQYTILIVVLSVSIIFFLVIVTAGIVYRYRWDLRYFYYSVKIRMNNGKRGPLIQADDEMDFLFDVFVSYATENVKFVKNDLVPELEEKRHLDLLIHDRDFRAGEFVNDNIMHAITTSRKTLILMSRDFLRSDWCVFEMNMARMEAIKTGRNVICLIMLERVPVAGLPLEIMDIIRQQTYLEVPDDPQYFEMFWDRVHDALMN